MIFFVFYSSYHIHFFTVKQNFREQIPYTKTHVKFIKTKFLHFTKIQNRT
ncbi:hypothetical protein LEP1GSC122_0930 [Leptospira kirschneri serovar Valbuzzi str. 200702274]|nr:hypothetical protein LEP1GSC122_0930 [Leptospira kirschneri serovar Valbuzzi str. 200702274]